MKRFLLAAVFFFVLILLWEALYRAKIWSPVLLPSPRQVGIYLEHSVMDGTLATATVITMRRLLIGYLIGLVVGLPLGLLTARWKLFGDTIGTMALGLQTLPSVCWVPLALLWFGQTEAAMLFVVVMGTLWSVVIATDTGVRNVPPIYRRAALTMGSKRLHMWFKVILPAALPFIVSGMNLDITAVGNPDGLGKLVLFFVLFLVVRGAPVLLIYRGVLVRRDRLALALLSSTQLPLVVAITSIAVAGGHMRTSTAAALVIAATLTTLFFVPVVYSMLRGKAKLPDPEMENL